MTTRRPRPCPETVTLETQDELDRLAMVMMQLDMALALAREKRLVGVEAHLEAALEEARQVRQSLLN
ncbi:MAG: hypothetical protein KUA43_07075 [Hoeflea sp.]|uniref:hypothetical protein n=1 Tax=Hoeflea sp. TaxID=1940281 RepID=UPI001D4DF8B8|nr:hypothetical protein [Hoeflea sp.]MBU4530027.1 hypothetical protein [Alphaproteobacteria bacterium]MBU4542688.1 hypothetical protein [Alphaproteobacteria bacterium]MBU4551369.1 hypothetical protein [Alphaproteobacteria bacterium]MBV1723192.1 hypothetical protein [Hoeflea sp.]MBV1760203.1 hypothetical protein [Hoeflea sp.]